MDLLAADSSKLNLSFGGATAAGPKPKNQDALAARQPEELTLRQHKGVVMAIADGVSSSPISEQASQMAVLEFIDEYYQTPNTWSIKKSAANVLKSLNNWFYAQNVASRHRDAEVADGLITTLTTVIVKSRTAYICHAGDSRLYLLRDGRLNLLTQDHSRRYGGGFVLTTALGADQHLDVDFRTEELRPDDVLLLSTDGLHGFFAATDPAKPKIGNGSESLSKALQSVLADHPHSLELAADALMKKALANGCDDNVSCLLGRVDSLPLESIDEAHERLTALQIPPVLSLGTKIDGYEVQSVLHNSTRSHLYDVKRLSDGKAFVLKAPSQSFATDMVYLDGFVREQWVGQQLDHPCVMKTYPRPADSLFMYMLCEKIPGQTLRQWIVDNPAPSLDSVRSLLKEIVRGLRVLQRAGIVHRDLKPENVMVHDGRCVLIDYGTAQVRGLDELASAVREDVPVGSVNYIAPEYLLGNPATMQSDLFSLGCMAFEMLTGKLPYDMESSRLQQPESLSAWHYRPARRFRRELPQWVEVALEKATASNPQHRYNAYSELLDDMTRPGAAALKQQRQAPLVERYPQRFWQTTTLILLVIVLLQSMLLLQ